MRFRASIENVLTFSRILQAVEKLQRKCIIRFSETELQIICNHGVVDAIQVWSQIKVDSLFTDYRIQSNYKNEINIEVAPEALLQALKSAVSAPEVVMKLAKKNNHAVLNFEITGQSRQRNKVQISHDVLIEVLKPSEVEKMKEPLCPEPDVHIILPSLQKLRTVVEHMRQMSDSIRLEANSSGILKLVIATEAVSVSTQWTGCDNSPIAREPVDGDYHEEVDPTKMYSVQIAIRNFSKFLTSHVVSASTIACICDNFCIILYVYIGEAADAGGVLTFFIPALAPE